MKQYSASTYLLVVPKESNSMIIYLDSSANTLVHSNGRKSKTKYNFFEDITDELSSSNPNAAIFAGKYNSQSKDIIVKTIRECGINKIIISGWSLGGNDVVKFAANLVDLFPSIDFDILFFDSNHTDQLPDSDFITISNKVHKVYYLTDTHNDAKIAKQRKLHKYFDIEYIMIDIKKYPGATSNHRSCRDSGFDGNAYGYIWGYKKIEAYHTIKK